MGFKNIDTRIWNDDIFLQLMAYILISVAKCVVQFYLSTNKKYDRSLFLYDLDKRSLKVKGKYGTLITVVISSENCFVESLKEMPHDWWRSTAIWKHYEGSDNVEDSHRSVLMMNEKRWHCLMFLLEINYQDDRGVFVLAERRSDRKLCLMEWRMIKRNQFD